MIFADIDVHLSGQRFFAVAGLFTHGILHLLGYDHMTDEQEKEMFGLQDKILGALSIEREGV